MGCGAQTKQLGHWIYTSVSSPVIVWVGVALGYFCGFEAIRAMSVIEWLPAAGFRLACLLFIKRRYQGALLVGDVCVSLVLSLDCYPNFGLKWSMLAAVPPLALIMPVATVMRRYTRIGLATHKQVSALILCIALVSLILTLRDRILLDSALAWNANVYNTVPVSKSICAYFLGNLVGILTVLLPVISLRNNPIRRSMGRKIAMAAGWVIPVIGLLVMICREADGDDRMIAWTFTLVPVVVLAFQYRGIGVAWGGVAASAAIGLAYPLGFSAELLRTDTLFSFVIISALMLTAVPDQASQDGKQKAALRAEIAATEMRLHQFSIELERWYRHLQTELERVNIQQPALMKRTANAQKGLERAILNISPVCRQGLADALTAGPLQELSKKLALNYRVSINHEAIKKFPSMMQMMMYRLACGMTEILLVRHFACRLAVAVKGSERGLVLRVAIARLGDLRPAECLRRAAATNLYMSMGHNEPSIQALKEKVVLYDGACHDRGTSILVVLPCKEMQS